MRAIVALVVLLAVARPVCAGAWLRETGRTFLSVSGTLRDTTVGPEQELGLYAEYGFAPRLTLGLDVNDRSGVAGHALVFARTPLLRGHRRWRLAAELAAGGHHWQADWYGMLRATLSLGRGFDTPLGAGWANLDAAVERRYGFARPAYKLDLTVGLSQGQGLRPLMQVETTHVPGQGRYWTVTPSVQIDSGRDTTWLIGVERKSPPQDSYGLKLSLWRRF